MTRRLAAAGRLFLIYGIPFGVIVIADKLSSMQGYATSIIFVCIAWMFGFHFLLNGSKSDRRDRKD
jgi:hypothetical protein